MKIISLFFLGFMTFSLMTGCGIEESGGEGGEDDGDEEEAAQAQGVHFQGRDCLLCHNVDLGPDRRLTVAGTVFKRENPDVDRIEDACGGNLTIQFLDGNRSAVFDSGDYEEDNSKGNKGKGNVFILQRMLAALRGEYIVRIVSENGVTLTESAEPHRFQSEFDPTLPADPDNTHSCNACHATQPVEGAAGPIAVRPGLESSCG